MRVVTPDVWRAIELIAEQKTTAEQPHVFRDSTLDMLILLARAFINDDTPLGDT